MIMCEEYAFDIHYFSFSMAYTIPDILKHVKPNDDHNKMTIISTFLTGISCIYIGR